MTTTPGASELYWDPIDIEIDVDPHPTWRRLRDEAPVYHNEQYGFYALSRYADVEFAHRQPATFSSAHGTVLELITEDEYPGGMMIFKDPPDHSRLRTLVSRAFTPRRVNELEERIRSYCREMAAEWRPGTPFDFVGEYGGKLPPRVIAELLGVPAADRDQVTADIHGIFHIEPGLGMMNDQSAAAIGRIHAYLSGLVAERTANPQDDMISALTVAELTEGDETRRLTTDEVVDFVFLLVSAGTETVGKLLGWAGLLLGEHVDQQHDLRANPELIPNAIEELLRYEAPSPVQGRWTVQDAELHGTIIPAGSKVLLLTGSAGRDERVYPDGDRFDVRRKTDRHVSFGYGAHFCLGAALARLEGRVALEEALAHTGEWTADRAAAAPVHTSTVRGWSAVPVVSS